MKRSSILLALILLPLAGCADRASEASNNADRAEAAAKRAEAAATRAERAAKAISTTVVEAPAEEEPELLPDN